MPRITVEDRRLIISVPFELVQMPSAFMTTEDDTLVVDTLCAALALRKTEHARRIDE